MQYLIASDAIDRDGHRVRVYIAKANSDAPLTTAQRDAARYETKDSAVVGSALGFRPIRLRPRA